VKIHCTYDRLVPVGELRPHPDNKNSHGEDQIGRLAKILEYQGWRYPIKVSNQTGFITSGHGRLMAAQKLGLEKVPVNFQDYDSKQQEYSDLISDNSIAEWSELDLSGINADIPDFDPDFDIELLGLKDFEVEPADKYADKDEAADNAIPDNAPTRVKPGEIWQLGEHRLMCGDATNIDDVNSLVEDNKIDMVFTDPPYGVSYEKKCNEIANQSKTRQSSKIQSDDLKLDDLQIIIQGAFNNIDKILADKSCYYIASPQGGELGLMMMMMQEANLLCRHMMIWVKNAPVFSMGRLDYDYQHEPILYGWSKNRTHHKSTMSGQWKSSIWELPREKNKLHPTMKPIALMENAINNSCPKSGRVYDAFGGSGSTLIACEKTNRKCYMMEIESKYCDVIIKRWEDYTSQVAERINAT